MLSTCSWAILYLLVQYCHCGASCDAIQLTLSVHPEKMRMAKSKICQGRAGTMAITISNTHTPFVWLTQSMRVGLACYSFKGCLKSTVCSCSWWFRIIVLHQHMFLRMVKFFCIHAIFLQKSFQQLLTIFWCFEEIQHFISLLTNCWWLLFK